MSREATDECVISSKENNSRCLGSQSSDLKLKKQANEDGHFFIIKILF